MAYGGSLDPGTEAPCIGSLPKPRQARPIRTRRCRDCSELLLRRLTMRPPNHSPSIHTVRADALFASTMQRRDDCSADQIRLVIAQTIKTYGGQGCAGRVAQEYGDHPETSAARMRWARAAADRAFATASPKLGWLPAGRTKSRRSVLVDGKRHGRAGMRSAQIRQLATRRRPASSAGQLPEPTPSPAPGRDGHP